MGMAHDDLVEGVVSGRNVVQSEIQLQHDAKSIFSTGSSECQHDPRRISRDDLLEHARQLC